jgi:hypothetical protein
MALIIEGVSSCALCGHPLNKADGIVSTPHFVANPADPLWRFADAGMHCACFLTWPRRAEFVARFNAFAAEYVAGNGTVACMDDAGTITRRPAVGGVSEPAP